MTGTAFDDLRARAGTGDARRLAVAGGDDAAVIAAVIRALEDGYVGAAIVTGSAAVLATIPSQLKSRIELRRADSPTACAGGAVAAVRAGEADILMKGQVDSTSYLRAVVNRDHGIRKGGVLSNITVAAMPSYRKFLAATDNGITPAPTLEQKGAIIRNTAPLFRGLGLGRAKVACIAATEKVSEALVATSDAAALAAAARAGGFAGFLVDGPMGYDAAINREAAATKKLDTSPVAGDADLLLFPTIDAANAVVKSWKYHGQAATGSIVLGARVPVLLNSRSDGIEARLNALALAIATISGDKE